MLEDEEKEENKNKEEENKEEEEETVVGEGGLTRRAARSMMLATSHKMTPFVRALVTASGAIDRCVTTASQLLRFAS
jgi:hypothetical protein